MLAGQRKHSAGFFMFPAGRSFLTVDNHDNGLLSNDTKPKPGRNSSSSMLFQHIFAGVLAYVVTKAWDSFGAFGVGWSVFITYGRQCTPTTSTTYPGTLPLQ
jgi:hypothetical protein